MPVTLLLGVHAHQPVGNFPQVMADAHQRCYRPFLQILHDYPDFRFAAHFSGWLLDWLRAEYPEDMELMAEMVRRGQIEIFSSGDTEPVLAAIPHRDRVGQMRRLNEKLQSWTGQKPSGAWLTERVWESAVVPALAETGIRYTTVDDYHFLCTGLPADALNGYFSTEEGGVRLDLFPISEALRYRLPFSPASDAVAYLEQLAELGHPAAIYFDDIEKFGIWPETYDWVYTRGWLRQFIEGVLASDRITTSTYADFHRSHPTRGVVYLPTTSYSEMNEWTLPMPAARAYAQLVAQERQAGRGAQHLPFLRGGIWRGFLSRYAEANWMHKRMLGLSARLAALSAAPPPLTTALYRAQANDAYWHGLFGGLYLPHLRRAVWNNLVELEAGLDRLASRPALESGDGDVDGHVEIWLHNDDLQLVLRDDGHGAGCELLSYRLRHNFADTLRRYEEHYHDKIHHAPTEHNREGIASAHDIVRFKDPVTAADVTPDPLPRALFLDQVDDQPVGDYQWEGDGAFARPGVRKTYRLDGDALAVEWQLSGSGARRWTTFLNLAMPSCGGFLGRYVLADGSIPCGFGQPLDVEDAETLVLEDGVLGGRVVLTWTPAATVRCRPHYTVSQSEAGFEKIMQCAEIRLDWQLAGEEARLTLRLAVEKSPPPGEAGPPTDKSC